jgi:hypothetical protein
VPPVAALDEDPPLAAPAALPVPDVEAEVEDPLPPDDPDEAEPVPDVEVEVDPGAAGVPGRAPLAAEASFI